MKHFIHETVAAALAEDIGHGDITSRALISAGARCEATLLAKEAGVLSGMAAFREAFELAGAGPNNWEGLQDGERFSAGDVVARFTGQTREVLAAERTALNFVQRLAGIATTTHRFVEAVEGLGCQVCDTRKTTPPAQVSGKGSGAPRGGMNHRFNLTDGILIKENHIAAAGGIAQAISLARDHVHHLARIEVEVTNLDELREALEAGADAVLLDNMDNPTLAAAVTLRENWDARRVVLEASGNVTLNRIRSVAETGVDIISVGALTHSAPSIDLSLLIAPR